MQQQQQPHTAGNKKSDFCLKIVGFIFFYYYNQTPQPHPFAATGMHEYTIKFKIQSAGCVISNRGQC